MQDQDKAPTNRQQERQVHHLVANDLVHGQAGREAAVKAAVEAERARKPRRQSLSVRLKAATANDLDVIAILPDGTVQIGKAEAETAENVLPFDAWEAKRHAR